MAQEAQLSAKKILIVCAGLGMGNASRVTAILEAVTVQAKENDRDVIFHICSWGAGYFFLNQYKQKSKKHFDLTELKSYTDGAVSSDRRSWWGKIIRSIGVYFKNCRALSRIVRRMRPELIILDSDYHFFAYFLYACPVFCVGQAYDVIDRARASAYRSRNLWERINFILREKLDAFIQSFFSLVVLVPSFDPGIISEKKNKKIPLIVRQEFLSKPHGPAQTQIGILLSGSNIEREAFLSLALEYDLKIISPNATAFESHVPCQAEDLDQFDIVLVQGGLGSISECIARGKFMVVFPMKNHPEQILNSSEIERLGLGMAGSLSDLKHFPTFVEKILKQKTLAQSQIVQCTGAEVAAKYVAQFLFTPVQNASLDL